MLAHWRDADMKIAETNVTERKERKFPEYEMMKFNWKEVEPIYKGQSK